MPILLKVQYCLTGGTSTVSIPSLQLARSFGPSSFDRPASAADKHEGAEGKKQNGGKELSEEEQREVKELKRRDREVRSHEAAHMAAGGQYTSGGISYAYQTGPDGKRYATGGEVSIDTSPIQGDPEATIRKMQTVRKAALAPAQPSGQDRMVAAKASQQENQARQEIAKRRSSSPEDGTTADNTPKTGGYTQGGARIPHSSEAQSINSRQLDLIA
ncbi:MAG: hypothetical protein GF344_08610 [Chitinivibrionales bacterium]|nr:hypothetical protein [Chitinivibrionales bacterium]MBD3356937.1 hypothetical protein [Chitinivibrionales bacterium]